MSTAYSNAVISLKNFIDAGNEVFIHSFNHEPGTWKISLKVYKTAKSKYNSIAEFTGAHTDFAVAVNLAFEEMQSTLTPDFIKAECTPPLLAGPGEAVGVETPF